MLRRVPWNSAHNPKHTPPMLIGWAAPHTGIAPPGSGPESDDHLADTMGVVRLGWGGAVPIPATQDHWAASLLRCSPKFCCTSKRPLTYLTSYLTTQPHVCTAASSAPLLPAA